MKLLESTLLETFVTVVECGGFSDAQFALGITQSAISIRIRDLETALGYRVCERGRGGFRLTERGEVAYRKAREILRSVRDFDAELLELRGSITGELRIGMVDAVSGLPGFDLAQSLETFLSRPSDVQLELVVASPSDLTQGLLSGSLHVAIAPFRNRVPEVRYRDLCQEHHALYCGRSHALFQCADHEVTPDLVKGYPSCQRSYDSSYAIGADAPDLSAIVSNMEAMALMVESGQFIGVLPRHFAEDRRRLGRMRELAHPDLRWSSTVQLATRRNAVSRRAVDLFMRDCLAQIPVGKPNAG
ncbi:LysR family transcriptional regulator [Aliiroseovarius crassostreae]|uniref:LysR family transcriptional regulator n=1 Tax=Aliiroseovarius crassostreae TaxID=154981 RepID=UPI003C7978A4